MIGEARRARARGDRQRRDGGEGGRARRRRGERDGVTADRCRDGVPECVLRPGR